MMAKFGPFCRRVNCSLDRGMLERLIIFFLNIIYNGKYMRPPPNTPSLYLHVDLQQCHLGKFLYNILLD